MNYATFRDHVLQLIDQYSIRGKVVDELYNDQADFILKIPGLYNFAMIDICTYSKPLLGVIDKEDCEDTAQCHREWVVIDTPSDLIKMCPVLMFDRWGKPYRAGNVYQEGSHLRIHRDLWEKGVLEYERLPKPLTVTDWKNLDEEILDADPEQLVAAALYVAARLVMNEDAFAYSSLMNEYDDRCVKMQRKLTAETLNNPDVYGIDVIYG